MNERDKELADEAEAYADRDFKGEINWGEAYESKLIALIRADEREACANIDFYEILRDVCNKEQAREYSNYIEIAIRARGNT